MILNQHQYGPPKKYLMQQKVGSNIYLKPNELK